MLGADLLNDTIVAIGTPVGESGIGIVRISGKGALAVADKIFVSKNNKKASGFKTYTTHYGWVIDSSSVVRRPSFVVRPSFVRRSSVVTRPSSVIVRHSSSVHTKGTTP